MKAFSKPEILNCATAASIASLSHESMMRVNISIVMPLFASIFKIAKRSVNDTFKIARMAIHDQEEAAVASFSLGMPVEDFKESYKLQIASPAIKRCNEGCLVRRDVEAFDPIAVYGFGVALVDQSRGNGSSICADRRQETYEVSFVG